MSDAKAPNLSIVISCIALALTGIQAFVAWNNRDDNIRNILLQERIKFCTELDERMTIMHSAAIDMVRSINLKIPNDQWRIDLLNIRIKTKSLVDGKRFLFSEADRNVMNQVISEYESIDFEKAALKPERSSYSGYLKRWFDARMAVSRICENKDVMTSSRPFRGD